MRFPAVMPIYGHGQGASMKVRVQFCADMPRSSYRSFSVEIEQLAKSWSSTCVTTEQWQDLGPFGASESRPFRVQTGNLVGLAKPGEKKGDGISRAAHEK